MYFKRSAYTVVPLDLTAARRCYPEIPFSNNRSVIAE